MTLGGRVRRGRRRPGAAPTRPRRGSARPVAGTRTPLSVGKVGAFGGMVRVPAGHAEADAGAQHRRRRHQGARGARRPGGSTPWARTSSTTASTTSWSTAPTPIAFMDYIAGSGLGVEQIAGLVEGIARGCRAHGMALAGGETAQMPGLYQPGTYDLAGHHRRRGRGGRGAARRRDRARRRAARLRLDRPPHQRLHARPPHRLRADGARARRPARATPGAAVGRRAPGGAPELRAQRHAGPRAGCTGWRTSPAAASPGNLVRVLPPGCEAIVDPARWPLPPLFAALQQGGGISTDEMREVFNLGVGMIAVLPADAVSAAQRAASEAGVATWAMGEIRRGDHGRPLRPALTA